MGLQVVHIYNRLIIGIITVNPPEVKPVFTLPTRSSKLNTLPT